MKDITTREDIELLVNSFYDKVKKDEIICTDFNFTMLDNVISAVIDST